MRIPPIAARCFGEQRRSQRISLGPKSTDYADGKNLGLRQTASAIARLSTPPIVGSVRAVWFGRIIAAPALSVRSHEPSRSAVARAGVKPCALEIPAIEPAQSLPC